MKYSNNPFLTVIMSVYNCEKYLSDSIKSILNQTYQNFEYIIINDGSTDKSQNIIEKFKKKNDKIIFISQKNKGLTKSLNIAINKSKGEYIVRMDADDISLSDRLEKFIKYLNINNQLDIYTTPAILIDEQNNKKKIIPNYFKRNGFNQNKLKYYNFLIHGTLIIKKNLIKKFRYNESYTCAQDFELYHRLIYNDFKISYDVSNISYKLRIHRHSISSIKSIEQTKMLKKVLKTYNYKYYENNLLNKFFFIIIDILNFILKKFENKIFKNSYQ